MTSTNAVMQKAAFVGSVASRSTLVLRTPREPVTASAPGAAPALGLRPNSLPPRPALQRPPVASSAMPRRGLMSSMDGRVVCADGEEEQILPRRWWPEDERIRGGAAGLGTVRFVLQLASNLDPADATCQHDICGPHSASVAVVLRVTRHGRLVAPALANSLAAAVTAVVQQNQPRSTESVEEQIAAMQVKHGEDLADIHAEVLYISRTVVGADGSRDARRWSGQVAFPGGKRQGDEAHLETACRECLEEVGLDLTGPEFRLLGRLAQRKAKADMTLNSFVFLHTSGSAELQPAAHEVADAWWVPIEALASRAEVGTLFRSLQASLDIPRPLKRILRMLGVRGLLFPCLSLPPPVISTAPSSASSFKPPLWGLTLGLTSDLLWTGQIQECGGVPPTNPRVARAFEFGDVYGRPMPWAKLLAIVLAEAYQGRVMGLGLWRAGALVTVVLGAVLVMARCLCPAI